jgi:hypothetical protein
MTVFHRSWNGRSQARPTWLTLAIYGRWTALSCGHSDAALNQVTDLRAATVSVALFGGLFHAGVAGVKSASQESQQVGDPGLN